MARVFLSVGSNLGDRLGHVRAAVARLRQVPEVTFLTASRLYFTEPWERQPGGGAAGGGAEDQADWFYNCVVVVETSLDPLALLEHLQGIEGMLGRIRTAASLEEQRYEARTLDIDILLYGDRVISAHDRLHVPHLMLHERQFVLRPLADLAPDLEHPVLYETIQVLLDRLEDEHAVMPADVPERWFEAEG
jgi:2-amino-4-hydroxy-6-hydroxymethyldihydropteridine diphosphokinase